MSETRLIHGFHAVTAKLRQDADSVLEVYVDASRQDTRARDLVKLAQTVGARLVPVEAERLSGMCGNRRHQGVVARIVGARKERKLDEVLEALMEPALLLVLDGVQDPHNLGACLRVADGAGAHAVIAPKDRAVGLNATAIRVASGAADTVPYVMVTNLARALRGLQERNVWCIGTADDAEKDIYSVDMTVPLALVFGAEGHGMRRLTRETCDGLANIPMHGSIDSLNVSVACGICLYEARRQRMRKAV